METRHPVGGPFGLDRVFGICNHCKTWKLSNFCVFFLENDALMYNFQNSVTKVYMATPIDVVVFKCRKIFWREIGEIVRYLPDKKFGSLSNCRYCTDRAISLPGPTPNIWLIMFQISSKSVHFQRSYSRTREGRSFGPSAMHGVFPWFASNTVEANNNYYLYQPVYLLSRLTVTLTSVMNKEE